MPHDYWVERTHPTTWWGRFRCECGSKHRTLAGLRKHLSHTASDALRRSHSTCPSDKTCAKAAVTPCVS